MTNPKNQIRAYLRSFNFTDDGMAEVENLSGAVETGEYVRTIDYLLMRNAAENEIERLQGELTKIRSVRQFTATQDEPPAEPPLPKRPSDPPPTARLCSACNRIKDDSGETYGWGLCHCGSFRQATADNM